ncbi:hypothetical protein [Ulvibacter litoralis]|uniref:Prophage protein n=1 Tax=Ulvibacter litoralis TaxID=227084 RepID=A0A1G7CZG9_9FLAO|nr:hypothetical protein [Ulvibacter litoralis]GHC45676.1 hypothetical protein GCM10008083_05670 [Ulvibacter litoralis]SDE44076.1 hypothetical protein SAMN05421855_101632 [Ulvibacter litoralis]
MKLFTCKIKGHKLTTIKKDSILIKEFECINCKKKFTTDGYGKVVKLNSYWEQNNLLFEQLQKRQKAQAS